MTSPETSSGRRPRRSSRSRAVTATVEAGCIACPATRDLRCHDPIRAGAARRPRQRIGVTNAEEPLDDAGLHNRIRLLTEQQRTIRAGPGPHDVAALNSLSVEIDRIWDL